MMNQHNDYIYHEPVMVEEVVSFIMERKRDIFVDCTLGDGGHSREILSHSPDTFVLGIDVDDEALEVANKRLGSKFQGRFKAIKGDYRELPGVLARFGVSGIGGMLLDLGVSSRQLDEAHRGFSYWTEAPLDMRMNPDAPKTARDILAESSQDELERILRDYGEERFARRIARTIVERRKIKEITTTTELVDAIKGAMPVRTRSQAQHPARKTFQALRIATNDELSRLNASIVQGFHLLEQGGVILIITYHSLEDRIAKNTFRDIESKGLGTVRTRKVVRPSEAEIKRNPRSRSAKLRVIQR